MGMEWLTGWLVLCFMLLFDCVPIAASPITSSIWYRTRCPLAALGSSTVTAHSCINSAISLQLILFIAFDFVCCCCWFVLQRERDGMEEKQRRELIDSFISHHTHLYICFIWPFINFQTLATVIYGQSRCAYCWCRTLCTGDLCFFIAIHVTLSKWSAAVEWFGLNDV